MTMPALGVGVGLMDPFRRHLSQNDEEHTATRLYLIAYGLPEHLGYFNEDLEVSCIQSAVPTAD